MSTEHSVSLKVETASLKRAAFDLSTLDNLTAAQEDGIDVNIVHPATGDDIGLSIRVAGPDSQRRRKAQQRLIDARLKRRRAKPLSAEEIEDENLRTAAASVIGWSFAEGVTIDGERPEFSTDAVFKLYKRYRWIAEQVEAEGADRAGFTAS